METKDNERKQNEPGPVHRKRTRAGCLPCRSRRRKCDGALPRCRNCEQRGCTCQWGVKASFHPSRSLRLSGGEIVALAAIEKRRAQRSRQPHGPPTIIDETGEILRGYKVLGSGASHPYSDNDHLELEQRESSLGVCGIPSSPQVDNGGDIRTPDILHEEPHHPNSDDTHRPTDTALSVADLFAPNLQTFGRSPLSSPIHNRSYSDASSSWRRGHAIPFTPSRSTSKIIPSPEPPLPVSNAEKLRLISAYMQETGTWCETTDSDMHFTVRSIHDMMESPSFVGAAMALASRQLDYVEGCERQVTLELYQYTIQLLLQQNTAAPDPSVLAACTLLCVYEMMASEVHEWRRHLKGCAGLLQAQKWNGSAPGIGKSCFWAFARIDIWAAFITQNTTLIPTDFWLDDTSCKSVRTAGSIDDYCNLAILIFARIVNLLALRNNRENEYYNLASTTQLLTLWDELQEWHRHRPPEVYPLLRDPRSPGKVFPTVIFSRAASICGNTFYHTGCILLLQTGVVARGTPRSGSREKENPIWHARELAGISMSNPSHANWVNHLHPLYIAGAAFGESSSQTYSRSRDTPLDSSPGCLSRNFLSSAYGSPQTTSMIRDSRPALLGPTEEYPAEKLLLLKHLARIERETGWKTSDRAADLRIFWGLG